MEKKEPLMTSKMAARDRQTVGESDTGSRSSPKCARVSRTPGGRAGHKNNRNISYLPYNLLDLNIHALLAHSNRVASGWKQRIEKFKGSKRLEAIDAGTLEKRNRFQAVGCRNRTLSATQDGCLASGPKKPLFSGREGGKEEEKFLF